MYQRLLCRRVRAAAAAISIRSVAVAAHLLLLPHAIWAPVAVAVRVLQPLLERGSVFRHAALDELAEALHFHARCLRLAGWAARLGSSAVVDAQGPGFAGGRHTGGKLALGLAGRTGTLFDNHVADKDSNQRRELHVCTHAREQPRQDVKEHVSAAHSTLCSATGETVSFPGRFACTAALMKASQYNIGSNGPRQYCPCGVTRALHLLTWV